MIRTSSVNGSAEMEDETLAMAIECLLVGQELDDWKHVSFCARARRDPEDQGSIQIEDFSLSVGYQIVVKYEPGWKKLIRKIFDIE